MADRVEWKACKVLEYEENKMAADFRMKFQRIDFNLIQYQGEYRKEKAGWGYHEN